MSQTNLDAYQLTTVLRRSWLVIVLLFVFGAGGLGFVSSRAPYRYQASTRILIYGQGLTGASTPSESIATEIELARSEVVLGRVLKDLRITDQTIAEFQRDVSVTAVTSQVVEIKATAGSAAGAARRANAIAKEFLGYRTDSTGQAVDALRQGLRRRLADQQTQVAENAKAIQATSLDLANAATDERRAEVLRTLNQLETERADLSKVLNDLRSREQEEGLAQELTGQLSKVVTRAVPPENRTSPKPLRMAAIGGLLGLALGVGTALLRASIREGRLHAATMPPANPAGATAPAPLILSGSPANADNQTLAS